MSCSRASKATRGRDRRRSDLSVIDFRAVETVLRTERRPAGSGALRMARFVTAALRLVMLVALVLSACRPALAVQSVRVSADSDAIDLTRAVEHYSAQGDRIQVSTAPGADGGRPSHRGERARGRRRAGVDRVRADRRFRRAADSPHCRPPLSLRRLGSRLARSRLFAHHHDHREPGTGPRAGRQPPGRRVSPDARPRHDGDLCRRTAHPLAAAALSVGAGRLQGQVDQPHPLRGAS